MARPVFWSTQDSYTLGYGGIPYAGIPVRIYTAQTGGTQVTDLQYVNAAGTATGAVPSGVLTSDASGLIPSFAGPDGGATTLWGNHGLGGERLALTSDPTGSGGGGGGGLTATGGGTVTTTTAAAADTAFTGAYGPGGTAGNIDLPTASGAAAGLAIVFGGI